MEKVPYNTILDISHKVNIVDVISDYLPLEKKGKNYFAICPFHDDHNPSMSISPEKQIIHVLYVVHLVMFLILLKIMKKFLLLKQFIKLL